MKNVDRALLSVTSEYDLITVWMYDAVTQYRTSLIEDADWEGLQSSVKSEGEAAFFLYTLVSEKAQRFIYDTD